MESAVVLLFEFLVFWLQCVFERRARFEKSYYLKMMRSKCFALFSVALLFVVV